jgi:putative endonuclease
VSQASDKLGNLGEQAAAEFLERAGHRVLARNFRCPLGELDLITFHEGTLVFVEVKTLSGDATDPEEHVTPAKQRKLAQVAEYWIAQNRRPQCAYRFDAVSVVLPNDGGPRVRHFVEAFIPR